MNGGPAILPAREPCRPNHAGFTVQKPLRGSLVQRLALEEIARTSSTGEYSFNNLNPGKYRLAVIEAKERVDRRDVTLPTEGLVGYDLHLPLSPVAIEGQVLVGRAPVADAQVIATRGNWKRVVDVDSKGRFRFSALTLAKQPYHLHAIRTDPENPSNLLQSNSIEIHGHDKVEITFRLSAGGTIDALRREPPMSS